MQSCCLRRAAAVQHFFLVCNSCGQLCSRRCFLDDIDLSVPDFPVQDCVSARITGAINCTSPRAKEKCTTLNWTSVTHFEDSHSGSFNWDSTSQRLLLRHLCSTGSEYPKKRFVSNARLRSSQEDHERDDFSFLSEWYSGGCTVWTALLFLGPDAYPLSVNMQSSACGIFQRTS